VERLAREVFHFHDLLDVKKVVYAFHRVLAHDFTRYTRYDDALPGFQEVRNSRISRIHRTSNFIDGTERFSIRNARWMRQPAPRAESTGDASLGRRALQFPAPRRSCTARRPLFLAVPSHLISHRLSFVLPSRRSRNLQSLTFRERRSRKPNEADWHESRPSSSRLFGP